MQRLLLVTWVFLWAFQTWAGTIHGKITILEQGLSSNETKVAQSHQEAVIFITGFDETPVVRASPLYHDQQEKKFVPSVLAITKDESVTFRNKDSIHHNAFSLSKTKPFDLGLYKDPEEKSLTFETPGIVKIFCNIHPQMISTILILKNNKYFVTQADGKYQISSIPEGKHQLKIWIDGAALVSKDITVTASSEEEHNFEIPVVRQPIQHLNKFGKPYPKY